MTTLISNLVYWLGLLVATLFAIGGAAVLVTQAGESPLVASGIAFFIGLLSYGFGWSGQRLLQSRG